MTTVPQSHTELLGQLANRAHRLYEAADSDRDLEGEAIDAENGFYFAVEAAGFDIDAAWASDPDKSIPWESWTLKATTAEIITAMMLVVHSAECGGGPECVCAARCADCNVKHFPTFHDGAVDPCASCGLDIESGYESENNDRANGLRFCRVCTDRYDDES